MPSPFDFVLFGMAKASKQRKPFLVACTFIRVVGGGDSESRVSSALPLGEGVLYGPERWHSLAGNETWAARRSGGSRNNVECVFSKSGLRTQYYAEHCIVGLQGECYAVQDGELESSLHPTGSADPRVFCRNSFFLGACRLVLELLHRDRYAHPPRNSPIPKSLQ